MATATNYPIDLPILVIEAQIFVAVNKFQFLPNKQIPSEGGGLIQPPPTKYRFKSGYLGARTPQTH